METVDVNKDAHLPDRISSSRWGLGAEHVVWLTLTLYVAHVVHAVFAARVLYADGVNFFVNILANGAVSDGGRAFARLYANALTEAPLLTLVRLEVTNMEILGYAYAIGLYLPYVACILVWLWATRKAKAYRLFLLMYLFACAMNSEFFLVSESHAAAALTFALLPLLLFRIPWGPGTACLALALAAPTVRSYESMLILGPILAAACAWRGMKSSHTLTRVGWGAFMCWFLSGAVVALSEVLNPSLPESQTAVSFLEDAVELFRDNMLGLLAGNLNLHFAAILSMAGMVLAVSSLVVSHRLLKNLVVGFAVGSALLLLLLAVFPAMMEVGLHYKARVLNAIVPLFLGLGLLVLRVKSVDLSRRVGLAFMVMLILGVFQCGWHLIATNQWAGYVSIFREELSKGEGYIQFEDTLLAERRIGRQSVSGMNWPWTAPLMSIVLTPDGEVGSIIANPQPTEWEPFDPVNPAELPDLSRYGIGYDEYLNALLER